MQPQDLLYAKTHEWAHVSDEGADRIATIGISHFAVEALTDLVFLELPEVGRQVKAGDSFGELESVEADDPYGEAWIVKIKITDDAGLSELMDHATYQKQCAEEGH